MTWRLGGSGPSDQKNMVHYAKAVGLLDERGADTGVRACGWRPSRAGAERGVPKQELGNEAIRIRLAGGVQFSKIPPPALCLKGEGLQERRWAGRRDGGRTPGSAPVSAG
jgi:hypothetical protein